MDNEALAALRAEYSGHPLMEEDVLGQDPVDLFQGWFEEAVRAEVKYPNAMVLATVDPSGMPDARVLLLKGIEAGHFVFYTNYSSAKGHQLAFQPLATMVFNWKELDRQVRVQGEVSRVSRAASEAYFGSRPRDSQLGAWASEQSEVIPSRKALETRFEELVEVHPEGSAIPTPEHWGGYMLNPFRIELWQGRPSRLHDRLRSERNEAGTWAWARLAP